MIAKNFWLVLSSAAVIWYLTVTVYVAFKGAKDIKTMLAHLGSLKDQEEESAVPTPESVPETAE